MLVKKKVIITVIIVISVIFLVVLEYMIVRIILQPSIEKEQRIRDQSEEIDEIITIIPGDYEKYEFDFEGVQEASVDYEIDTDAAILFLIVNEEGYEEFKENESESDIDDDNIFEEIDLDDESETGYVYAEAEGYIIIINTDINDAEVELEMYIYPSNIPITPGYVGFLWLLLFGLIAYGSIAFVIIFRIWKIKTPSKIQQEPETIKPVPISPEPTRTKLVRKSCPYCGKRIQDETAQFCVNCGARLRN